MATQHFSTFETAKRLKYSIDNIHKLVQKGELIPVKMYSRNFFSNEEIERFEKSRQVKKQRQTTCNEY